MTLVELLAATYKADAGPWRTLSDDDGHVHVYPDYGPIHCIDVACWCHPVPDVNESMMIMHNAAH